MALPMNQGGGDTIQGVLSQLLGNVNPQARQGAMDQYRQAQQQYQNVLEEPLPDTGPVQRMVSDYLTRYGLQPNMDFSNVAGVIGGEAGRMRQQSVDELKRREFAAANKAKAAGEEVELQDASTKLALGGLRSMQPRGGAGATVKMDKDGNMVVYDPLSGTSKVVHASQRGEYQRIWTKAYDEAIEQNMTDPEGYAHSTAASVLARSPYFNPAKQEGGAPVAPTVPAAAAPAEGEVPKFALKMNELPPEAQKEVNAVVATANKGNGKEVEKKLAEIAARYGATTQPGAQTPTPAQPAAPVVEQPPLIYKDKPRAAMKEEAAKGVGKAAATEFEAVKTSATSAAAQYEAMNQLEKIDPRVNRFAGLYANVAEALSALGQDPSSPIIQDAIKTRQSDVILNQLRNASLKAEKGVQTAGDEKRIAAELPKTTDLAQVWDYSIRLGRERAKRKMDQSQFYTNFAEGSSGDIVGASSAWDKQTREDPLTQYLGGKLIFRQDFLDSFLRKYPDATEQEAVEEWKEMEREYIARGRRK